MREGTNPGMLLREAVAMARQGLLLPRVSGAVRETAPASHLTVFVHGYMASGGVFDPLGRHLARRGAAARQLHFSYLPTGSVAQHAAKLGERIREAQAQGPVQIVAHSLGGLLARYYVQMLGGRVDQLVCLATPHHGTRRAERWSSLPLAREISPGSATLRLLDETRARLSGVRVCSIVASGDAMVMPVESAALHGHEVVRLAGVGHQAVLFDGRAWDHVERVLGEGRGQLPRAVNASIAA